MDRDETVHHRQENPATPRTLKIGSRNHKEKTERPGTLNPGPFIYLKLSAYQSKSGLRPVRRLSMKVIWRRLAPSRAAHLAGLSSILPT
jgi:hypothetical protein